MPWGRIGIIVTIIFWLLLCLRFWRLVGARNPVQRRLIAVAAGLGAGLIHIAGGMMLQFLEDFAEPAPESSTPRRTEDVRIHSAAGADSR